MFDTFLNNYSTFTDFTFQNLDNRQHQYDAQSNYQHVSIALVLFPFQSSESVVGGAQRNTSVMNATMGMSSIVPQLFMQYLATTETVSECPSTS